MSLKLFCDLCDVEIPARERFYDVVLNVKVHAQTTPITSDHQGYCYPCTKSGKALVHLMTRYEARVTRASEDVPRATSSEPPEKSDPSAKVLRT